MFRISNITKDWNEAGSFASQLNLYGFWDEHCFLTKSGDLGAALKIGGIDYESLDHEGRDYAVKRLEAALRSLDDKTRLYQILFKHNRPEITHAEYDDPLVRAAVEQRAAFLKAKSDRLYSIEIFWVVMIDGSYRKTGLLHALAQLPKQPRSSLRDLQALFSGNKERTLIYEQIERDRLRLQQRANSFARAAFAAHFTDTQIAGVSEQTPLGVEHFLEYLRAREIHETRNWPMTARDLRVLDEGDPIYTSLEHQALYAAWKMQSTNAEKIRQRFMQQGPQAKFTTVALPYIYPLFSLKRERKPSEDHGSRLRSVQRSLLDEA